MGTEFQTLNFMSRTCWIFLEKIRQQEPNTHFEADELPFRYASGQPAAQVER
jgi:hypothetical protein